MEDITESDGKHVEKESKDASDAAGLLGKLSVDEKKTDEAAVPPAAAYVKAEDEKSEAETKA